MIASPNYSARGAAPVRLVVVHTAEGSRTKESLGAYFQGDVNASSHVGIDAGGVEPYVDYSRAAWTLLNGNPISDNAELCAFAMMSRSQWLSEETISFYHPGLGRTVTVDSPKRILDNTAAWIRERCTARRIPIRKLTPAEVDAGMAGVIGHVDWTNSAVGQGDHTDPGAGFPWDYVIARAAGTTISEDDMSAEAEQRIADLHQAAVDTFKLSGVSFGRAIAEIRAATADMRAAMAANYVANKEPIGKTTADVEAKLDALTTELDARLSALEEHIAGLSTGTGLSVSELAKALADEQDRRIRDNDPTTGPTT